MTSPDSSWAHGTYPEIAAMVAVGAGSQASFDAVEAWRKARRILVDSGAVITRAYIDAGASWSGEAYAAFRASMGPITKWVDDATNEASSTLMAVDDQGAHADTLKQQLEPPPAAGAPAQVWTAANEDARRRAQLYVDATGRNRQQFNVWSQPPTVTLQVPAPGSARRAAVRDPAGTVIGPAGGGLTAGGPGASGAGTMGGGVTGAGAIGAATGAPAFSAGGPGVAGAVAGSAGARSGQDRLGSPGSASGPAGTGNGPGGTGGAGPAAGGGGLGGVPAVTAGAGSPGPGSRSGTGSGTGGVMSPFGPGALGGGAARAGGATPVGRGPAGDLPAPFVPGAPGALGTGGASPGYRTVPGYGTAEALPPGAGGRGRRPPEPGWSVPGREAPSRSPSWRDVVASEPAAAETAGSRAGAAAERSGMYPPMMGTGAGAGQGGSRRRPDFLVDDSGAFTDNRWFPGPVIGPDDPLPPP
jgi:hypothetical protein